MYIEIKDNNLYNLMYKGIKNNYIFLDIREIGLRTSFTKILK